MTTRPRDFIFIVVKLSKVSIKGMPNDELKNSLHLQCYYSVRVERTADCEGSQWSNSVLQGVKMKTVLRNTTYLKTLHFLNHHMLDKVMDMTSFKSRTCLILKEMIHWETYSKSQDTCRKISSLCRFPH